MIEHPPRTAGNVRRRPVSVADVIERVINGLGIAVLVTWIVWVHVRGPRTGASICRTRYEGAHTAADTAMVDEETTSPKPGISCGFLRRAHATDARAPSRRVVDYRSAAAGSG